MEEATIIFKELAALMPCGWEAKAKELGALRRTREIKSAEALLRLNLLYLTSAPSFARTAAMTRLGGSCHLNKNAVYKRIRGSGEWLAWLCQAIGRAGGMLAEPPELLRGKSVCLIDGSEDAVCGSAKADYRLHYCVDLFTLGMKEMRLTEAGAGERLSLFERLGPGDVVLADRAYGTIQGLEYLRLRGSDFVLRLRSNAFQAYDSQGRKIEVTSCFEALDEGDSASVQVCYRVGKRLQPVRLCAVRKSAEAEQAGLERLKKHNVQSMRGPVSERQQRHNRYIVLATSFGEDVSPRQTAELYRMRWQIELVFKRLKSLFHYNEIPAKLDATALSWFYGKLLLAALCETIVNRGRFPPSRTGQPAPRTAPSDLESLA